MLPNIGIIHSIGIAWLLKKLNLKDNSSKLLSADGDQLIIFIMISQLKLWQISDQDGLGLQDRDKILLLLTHPMQEIHWQVITNHYWLLTSGNMLITLTIVTLELTTWKPLVVLSTGSLSKETLKLTKLPLSYDLLIYEQELSIFWIYL